MEVLVTFSGKAGDILWSLPTVRHISTMLGVKVSMGVMPAYESLVPLLKSNSYIQDAFTIPEWITTGSPHGDQPWQPQNDDTLQKEYDSVYHLTYRSHPHGNQPLIDFVAQQQNITLPEPVCPFIDSKDWEPYKETYIAYAFNEMYKDQKETFLGCLSAMLGTSGLSSYIPVEFVDVSKLEWNIAKYVIKYAVCFVGCKSANYVLANGVGQRNIFSYEPCYARHSNGGFGTTFSNPHWHEVHGPLVSSPEKEAEAAAHYIKKWVKEKENKYAIIT